MQEAGIRDIIYVVKGMEISKLSVVLPTPGSTAVAAFGVPGGLLRR